MFLNKKKQMISLLDNDFGASSHNWSLAIFNVSAYSHEMYFLMATHWKYT